MLREVAFAPRKVQQTHSCLPAARRLSSRTTVSSFLTSSQESVRSRRWIFCVATCADDSAKTQYEQVIPYAGHLRRTRAIFSTPTRWATARLRRTTPSMTVSVVGPREGSEGYRKNRSPWLKKMSSDMPTAPSSIASSVLRGGWYRRKATRARGSPSECQGTVVKGASVTSQEQRSSSITFLHIESRCTVCSTCCR